MLTAPSLELLPDLAHGFSRSLRSIEEERAFAEKAGVGALPMLRLRQVHGAGVVRAHDALRREERVEGDALVTDRPGAVLAIATADCVPVLLVDGEARVAAAVHAGWRGMRARVIARALDAMTALGARTARIRAAVGPAIQGGCYEVGPEVREEFERSFPEAATLFEERRLDLVKAARAELARGGVAADSVSVLTVCTHCRPELASHRREGKARGTNLAVVALLA